MTTIGQTLLDIESLQQDVENQIKEGKVPSSQFVENTMNLTRVYLFDLLAHSSLDAAKNELGDASSPLIAKYYALSDQAGLHEDYIRWINIGGLFMVWNTFEAFVRELYNQRFKSREIQNLKDAYKKILIDMNLDQSTSDQMIAEFAMIRFVCSSLFLGGKHGYPKTGKIVLDGDTHTVEKGEPVKPIRMMTAINIFWRHYCVIMSQP